MLGNCVILFAALLSVIERKSLGPGIVGLSLTYALQISNLLNGLMRFLAELEVAMVSVERVHEYHKEIEHEAPYEIPESDPPPEWPLEGAVTFSDYETTYREGLDPVLKGISCSIGAGEKIGVVGRTGAGKSSLTLSLFRIIERTAGSISIDDIDISTIGLAALRSKLSIIPQDPVIYSGTLRSNLDPFDENSDSDVHRAVELSHLTSFVSTLDDGLEHKIDENGSNLSLGQRQLLCLARALLRDTKILVLDEATAAVDPETDELVQKTVRQAFAECTVITIAHRLATVLDSDRIMLMDKGKILEMGKPQDLLSDPQSRFAALVRNAGIELQATDDIGI